jgi:hypothetical protein
VAPLALIAVLAAATALYPAANIRAQTRSVDFYRSEQFDWYFFYDADQWQIEEQSSEPGHDDVRFSNGDTFVYYSTFDAAGMTPEDCVASVLTSLRDDQAVVDVTALSEEPGPPEIIGGDSSPAYTVLVVTADAGDGPFKFAVVETCASFDGGRTLVSRSIFEPAASYNEHPREFDSPEIVSSVDFGGAFDPGGVRVVPAPVSGADANGGAGSLAALLDCESPGPYYVIAQGLRGSFVINSDGFVARYVDSKQIASSRIEWLYPDHPSSASLTLQPGELGFFQLVVPSAEQDGDPSVDLQYVAPDAKPVSLGTSNGPCTGAGGGLPNTIDIDLPA